VKENPKLELVTVQTFQTTDTDFTAQTTNVLAAKPDLVIISGLAADGGNLVKQLRELGYKGQIVGGNGFNTVNIFPVCKALCDGILVAQAYSYQAAGEINQAFRTFYKEKQKKEPPQFSGQSFAAVQVVIDALRALDKKTPIAGMDLAKLRTELNKQIIAGTYQTPLGEISFKASPGGEIVQKDFYIAQIKMESDGTKGAFVFLKK
jgi:branched-chain amino acid transport system substrate-binding protein